MNANAANHELPGGAAETAVAAADLGPGGALREARERTGLDVLSAANRLNLHRNVIESLEADDFGALPEAIFVRGYLRNYARLLGLEADEMIARYERAAGVAPLKTTAAQSDRLRGLGEERSSSAGGGFAWLVVVLLVMALAGGGFVWWQQTQGGGEGLFAGAARDAESAMAGAPADPAESAWSREVEGDEAASGMPMPEAVDAAPMAEGAAEPVTEEPAAAEEPAEPDGGESTPAMEVESLPLAEPAPSVEAPAEREAVAGNSPTAAPADAGLVQLVARFSDDCWSEIVDGTGRKLLFRIAKAGEVATVEGAPPIKMLFGRANAVTLEVDGLPFDLAPHSQANVVRLTLGDAESPSE